jgi:hypothetical protein
VGYLPWWQVRACSASALTGHPWRMGSPETKAAMGGEGGFRVAAYGYSESIAILHMATMGFEVKHSTKWTSP